jgi:hypothetical protein
MGDPKGFVYYLDAPQLEDGTIGQHGFLSAPDNVTNGIIEGFFSPIAIQKGDHFQGVLGCKYEAKQCDIVFQVDYQIDSYPTQKLATVFEHSDGEYTKLDIDLSALAGQNVMFILTTFTNGPSVDDYGLWSGLKIVHNMNAVNPVPNSPGH